MDEAVDCAKKLFEDDDDEPLLALVSFTNYFVTEFDCKNPERDAFKYALVMKMYDRIGGTNERPDRQTFYQGYQQAVDQFTKF